MNPLSAITDIATASIPRRQKKVRGVRYVDSDGVASSVAYRPEVTIPGVKKWIPLIREWANTSSVTVRGTTARLSRFYIGGDQVEIELVHAGGTIRIDHKYPDQATEDLLKGEWVEVGGWQVRFDDGFRLPFSGFGVEPGTFLICPLGLEIRATGRFLRWMTPTFRIRRFVCDDAGAEVELSGLPKLFVTPRLVWGNSNASTETLESYQSGPLEQKLNRFIDEYSQNSFSSNSRKRMTRRWCRNQLLEVTGRHLGYDSGIGSMLLWWLIGAAARQLIKRLAERMFERIHS